MAHVISPDNPVGKNNPGIYGVSLFIISICDLLEFLILICYLYYMFVSLWWVSRLIIRSCKFGH